MATILSPPVKRTIPKTTYKLRRKTLPGEARLVLRCSQWNRVFGARLHGRMPEGSRGSSASDTPRNQRRTPAPRRSAKPAPGSARCPDRATRASARVRWNRARQARRKEMKVNEGTECGRRSLPRLGVDTPRPARWDRRALPSCAGAQAARQQFRRVVTPKRVFMIPAFR